MSIEELPSKYHKEVRVFSGSVHPELAEATAEAMGIDLGPVDLRSHSNEELYVRFLKNLRRKQVFIIQSHVAVDGFSPQDAIMQQVFMVDAAKRASAGEITAVVPVFGYMRQDRKAQGRESIAAARVARMLIQAGADRILSLDVHTQQQQGFVDEPYDHLTASLSITRYLRKVIKESPDEEFIMVSPDAGRGKATERFANHLGLDSFVMHKSKDNAGTLKERKDTRDVTGLTCVINDDMFDTAGTLLSAADALMEAGAKRFIAVATHGFFTGKAFERLQSDSIDKIVVTDTIPTARAREALGDKLEIISVAGYLGSAIVRISTGKSLSKLFNDENSI